MGVSKGRTGTGGARRLHWIIWLALALPRCDCADDPGPAIIRYPDAGTTIDAGETNTPDAGPTDAKQPDAGELRGDATIDAGISDSGASSDSGATDSGPNPAVCPVGLADGCCPLALLHGGTDPDCPALDCAQLTMSADIDLDAPSNDDMGGVGMAFTGRELLLAWGDATLDARYSYFYERRDVATGTITFGPVRAQIPSSPLRFLRGTPALAFEPEARELVWVGPMGPASRFRAHFMDLDGQPSSQAIDAGTFCNAFGVFMHVVWPLGARPLIIGESDNCTGGSWAQITRLEADQTPAHFQQTSNRPYAGFAAYDGLQDRIQAIWPVLPAGTQVMRWASFDPSTQTFSPENALPSPVPGADFEMANVSTDGQAFLVLGSVSRFQQSVGIVQQSFVGRYEPSVGWTRTTVLTGFNATRRLGEARIIWTGSGYVAAFTQVDGDGTSRGVTDQQAPRVELLSLSPEGVVRERAPLRPPDLTTVFAQLAWAGDKIAVTWVERQPNGPQQHKLRWLSCP